MGRSVLAFSATLLLMCTLLLCLQAVRAPPLVGRMVWFASALLLLLPFFSVGVLSLLLVVPFVSFLRVKYLFYLFSYVDLLHLLYYSVLHFL